MKRSRINQAIKELETMCEKYSCYLPPFCKFTPEDWQNIGSEYDEVRDCMLGFDITDYGKDDFENFGFSKYNQRYISLFRQLDGKKDVSKKIKYESYFIFFRP